MLAEEQEDYARPERSFPAVPGWWNNFLIPREGVDPEEAERWTCYPINRVWVYLQWIEGVRWPKIIKLRIEVV